jgi:hypothetical protein
MAKLSNMVFKGKIQGWSSNSPAINHLDSLGIVSDYKIISLYKQDPTNLLAKLCDLYGSDKGALTTKGHPYPWRSHTYTDYYLRLFSNSRQTIRRVFECGLGTNNPDIPSTMGIHGKPGASLRVWRDFFPNASVWGGDIDRTILFQEERIQTYYVNQLDNDSIQEFWKTVGVRDFDFMLDDGLHTFEAGSNLFSNSIDYLGKSGVYVIEDVSYPDLLRYKNFFDETDYLVDFVLLYGPDANSGDNNLVVVKKRP